MEQSIRSTTKHAPRAAENHPPFGYLLTLDLYGCQADACDDIVLCYQFLEELVVHLKMNKQSPPFLFRSDQVAYPDKAGLSGWVPLIESGIQIHTLISRNFISVDVYSCRLFEPDTVKALSAAFFSPSEIEANFILRGVKYNHA